MLNKVNNKNEQCDVCSKKRAKNIVVCSDDCKIIRKRILDIESKYFPIHGCDNCWGDLHSGCSEQCKKEFRESLEFGTDLWKLVHLITKHER